MHVSYIAMRDYQESVTTGQTHGWTDRRTDRRRTKWSLCVTKASQATQQIIACTSDLIYVPLPFSPLWSAAQQRRCSVDYGPGYHIADHHVFYVHESSSCFLCTRIIIMFSMYTNHHHVFYVHESSSCFLCTRIIIMYSMYTNHHHVFYVHESSSCILCTRIIMYSMYTNHHHVFYVHESSSCILCTRIIIMYSMYTNHHHVFYVLIPLPFSPP